MGYEVTQENEGELLDELQQDVDNESATMTPIKGRQLLQDVGVLIVGRWDMSFVILFDSFAKNHDIQNKMSLLDVDNVYFVSGFNPDR